MSSWTYGQDTLKTKDRNFIVVIEKDTYALVKKELIVLSEQKYQRYEKEISLLLDSINELTAINQNLESQIYDKDKFIIAKDTTYYKLKGLYTDLQNDYSKLKSPKLNGIIGGEVGATYNLDDKVLKSPYIALNLGLMFKRKYITTAKVGFNLNREIVIGLNGSMVF